MDTSSAKQDEVDNGRAEGAQRLSSAAGRLPEPGIDLEYNETGLTKKISRGGSTLAEYSYLADGARLSAVGSDWTGVRYLGSLIYSRASDGTLSLGGVLETSDYLPLGKRWDLTGGQSSQTVTDPTNRWHFSGKEEAEASSSAISPVASQPPPGAWPLPLRSSGCLRGSTTISHTATRR